MSNRSSNWAVMQHGLSKVPVLTRGVRCHCLEYLSKLVDVSRYIIFNNLKKEINWVGKTGISLRFGL